MKLCSLVPTHLLLGPPLPNRLRTSTGLQSGGWGPLPLSVPTATCPEGSLEAKRQSLSSVIQLTFQPDSDKENPRGQQLDPGQFPNQGSGTAPNCTSYRAQWILSPVHA